MIDYNNINNNRLLWCEPCFFHSRCLLVSLCDIICQFSVVSLEQFLKSFLTFIWTSANRGSVYRDTMRVINHLAAVQSHIQNWGSDSCAYKCLVCLGDGRTSKYSSLTARCTRHGTSLLQQEAASPFKAKRELVLSWWNVVAEPSTLFLNWTNVGITRLQDSFHKKMHWGAATCCTPWQDSFWQRRN